MMRRSVGLEQSTSMEVLAAVAYVLLDLGNSNWEADWSDPETVQAKLPYVISYTFMLTSNSPRLTISMHTQDASNQPFCLTRLQKIQKACYLTMKAQGKLG